LDKNSTEGRELADAKFKKKQEQFIEGQKAMAEYQASRIAMRENTARLRALRLARDADAQVGAAAGAKKSGAVAAAAGAKKSDVAVAAAAGSRKKH
jgi:hypothetical protein